MVIFAMKCYCLNKFVLSIVRINCFINEFIDPFSVPTPQQVCTTPCFAHCHRQVRCLKLLDTDPLNTNLTVKFHGKQIPRRANPPLNTTIDSQIISTEWVASVREPVKGFLHLMSDVDKTS